MCGCKERREKIKKFLSSFKEKQEDKREEKNKSTLPLERVQVNPEVLK